MLSVEKLESRLLLAAEVFTTEPRLAIPDNNESGVRSTIKVSTSTLGVVTDVNVLLRLAHTYQGDLSISLSDGTNTAVLVDRVGGQAGSLGYSADQFGARTAAPYTYLKIDDEGTSDLVDTGIHMYAGAAAGATGTDNLVGDFQPDRDTGFGYFQGTAGDQPLANLDGAGGNRAWTLTVRDLATGETGTLVNWGIELTGIAAGSAGVMDKVLYVAGTDNADDIKITSSDKGSKASIGINGAKQEFPVADFGRMVIFAREGNDKVALNKKLGRDAWVDAGQGDDSVQGGGGNNVVTGGPGADTLKGGPIDDVLIGGDGIDKLAGGKGKLPPGDSDLLIGESTAHDAHQAALLAILAEWAGANDYRSRVGNLHTGRDGLPMFDRATLTDDGDPDTLTGGKDLDWFIARPDDTIKDRTAGEELDFGGVPQPAQAIAERQAAIGASLATEFAPRQRKRL